MRVHLHDFSGHPFQVQLSRALARRGHRVTHSYCAQYVTGRGRLDRTPDDPDGLRILGVRADREFDKYHPVNRVRYELAYAKAWNGLLTEHPADVVVACNVPLFALAAMRREFRRRAMPWVLWHQDVASLAIGCEASRKLPAPAARAAAQGVQRLERSLVRTADRVVAIGTPFLEQYARWGLDTTEVEVLPNWAPLDEIRPRPRDNPWAAVHAPADATRLLYAGTLGRKHNPRLLLDLLDGVRKEGVDAALTVVSEGDGADLLKGEEGVTVLPFQPARDLPDALGSGDVLVALLEPDAAHFSIPSKVLSYLAAGRPVLALIPRVNPCTADIERAGGHVEEPTPEGARRAAEWVAGLDARTRERLGEQSRDVAEKAFDIERITDRFEDVLADAVGQHLQPRRPSRISALAR